MYLAFAFPCFRIKLINQSSGANLVKLDEEEPLADENVHVLWVGILLEGLLILAAVGFSLLGLYDHRQALSEIDFGLIKEGLVWGGAAVLPMLGILVGVDYLPISFFRSLRRFCIEYLKPLFQHASLLEIGLLSALAGLGEELLFRWSIQGGIQYWCEPVMDRVYSEVIALTVASLLFGLCHAVTKSYFAITFLIGLFLGGLMTLTQNWLVPAFAHAIYDFAALVYLQRMKGSSPQI